MLCISSSTVSDRKQAQSAPRTKDSQIEYSNIQNSRNNITMCQHQFVIGACGHVIHSFVEIHCTQQVLSNSAANNIFCGIHQVATRAVHTPQYCGRCGLAPTKTTLDIRRR